MTRSSDIAHMAELSVERAPRRIRNVCALRISAIALAIVLAATPHLRAAGADGGNGVIAGVDEPDDGSSMLIAAADFNRDGVADVAQIVRPSGDRSGPYTVQLLFGQKDGSFKPKLDPMTLKGDPRAIASGDFNGDGNPDLLIGDGNGTVTELLGDGKGNLRSNDEIARVGSAVSIAVGDFNRDGIPDVAVSDFRANAVTILLGSGNGSFQVGWSFALPRRGTTYYLAAADFNGDGVSDLAISSEEEGTFVVMLGNGNGTFTYAPALSNLRDPNSYCPT